MESLTWSRTTAFTDAAVAIALTLLVLPLVDVAREASGRPVSALISAHTSDFLAFLISFFVVMLFWRAHRRTFEHVRRLDETLLTLNSLWLLGVVFLPVPTAVLSFDEAGDQTGATLLYLGNLLFVALAGLAISGWLWRHPALHDPADTEIVRAHLYRGVVVSGMFLLVAGLALWLGSPALFLLALMPLARRFAPHRRRSP